MEPALERRLIARAQQGDMGAYEQLYRAYRDPLFHRIIRPRVRGQADAEDVLVETFTVALEKLAEFQWRGRSLFGWLARIAINKCHDLGRGVARDDKRRDALRHEPVPSPPRPDERVSRLADRAAATRQVEAVLATMNPRYGLALRLRLLEGRERAECAERLEIKLGTFDVLLLRATRSFRKAWQRLYGEEEEMP